MPLLNLTPASGSRSSSDTSYASLDGLAERMAEKRRKEEEERQLKLAKQPVEQARKEQERKKEVDRKAAEKRAKDKTFLGKITSTVKDVFSADTDSDKARRKAAGQPELYKDQQAQKKKTAVEFKKDTADEFDRGKRLNFSKDEITKRRDFYKTKGVDIDQVVSDRQAYEKLLAKYGGDAKKVAFARAKGTLSPEDKKLEAAAARFEKTLPKVKNTEGIYQRNQKSAAGAENVLEQAERGFVRGMAEPIIKTPANLQTALGAALQAVAPAGSRVDKVGGAVYEAGSENLDELARRIVNTGYGAQQADNPLVAGIGQGAGSLAASMSAAGALGKTSAAAGVFGLEAGTEQLRGAKDAGKGDIQSFITGAGAGVLEGLLEKVGLDKFLGASGKPFKQVVTRMVAEGAQEASQSLAQSGVQMTYTDVDVGQAITQALQEGGIGAIVGGGAGLPMSIAQNLESKGVDHDTAVEIGMNVQDRVSQVLEEFKGEDDPVAVETAQPTPTKKIIQVKEEVVKKSSGEPAQPKVTGTPNAQKLKLQNDKPAPDNQPQKEVTVVKPSSAPSAASVSAPAVRTKPNSEPKKAKTAADKYPTHLLQEYADFIKSLDDQATGGQMVTDGEGGYKRTSEHSTFYRDFYAEHGRKPTKADWFGEARTQINTNRADKAFIEYANDVISQPGTAAASGRAIRDWQKKTGGVYRRPPEEKTVAPKKPVAATGKPKQELRSSRQSGLDALANYDSSEGSGRESLRTAEDLTALAEQLNKAAQSGAILRRGDYKSKKNLGAFIRKKKKGKVTEEVIKLQDAIIKDPRMYATVLAHEMSHAIEYNINGNTDSTYKLFGKLTDAEERQIDDELKEIVDEIEGKTVAAAKADYFYKPTEMFARYIETLVLHPGKAEKIAPLVAEKFGELVTSEPLVADFLLALDGSLDKGFKNYTPDWAKDMRQMYRKHLGKRVGDIAYNAEVIRRAEIQRSQVLIDKLISKKFKDVKDDPALLFRAAEAILVTKDGQPQFGTHDFMNAFTEKEQTALEKAGWKKLDPIVEDGREGYVYTRQRYTPEQAKEIFEKLSPEGQQLIKDFTAAKEEAKDEFNRELLKELYKIDTKLEGWVHHYFEGKPMGSNTKTSLRTKVAGARKQRKGAEGYIEDFRKATEKAMLELEAEQINEAFIAKQLARISKPLAKGQKPDPGWTPVVADGKGGLRLPGEGGVVIIQSSDKKSIKLAEKRYQVPEDLARHYREVRDVPGEANRAARVLNRIAKYWTINVLIHPGSTTTNFFSGGLQYGAKIMNDFYLDVLSANFGMERTRNNLIAPIKVLSPRGWTNAPEWLYGGYRSTLAGQYASGEGHTKLDIGIDDYGNKMLRVFGLVETYWKKVIALSEGSKLAGVSNRRITQRLQKDEQEIVATLNEAIDTYAFDYDNKPLWLSKFDRGGGKFFKPFMTYPYKLGKFYTSFAASGFDRSLSWQQRTAKVLTLATIVMFIAMLYKAQEDDSETPEGTEKTPLSLKPGGRLFVGVKDGKELFVRTAKYPFFNLTSIGKAAVKRNGGEVMDILREQVGTVGPGVELFMLATGRGDQFSQYTPAGARIAEQIGSFIPVFRVLNDVGALIDEKSRSPETFVQGITSQLPIWGSEEMRTSLRGKPRTIKIPDESEKPRSIAGSARTVTTRQVTREREDVLASLLTGVYFRRIDSKEARKQELREIRDDAEEKIRELLDQGKENDAEALGEEYGLTIPKSVYRHYRAKRRKE